MPPYRRRNRAANRRPPPARSRHPFPRPPAGGGPRPAALPTFYRSSGIPAARPGHPVASPHPGARAGQTHTRAGRRVLDCELGTMTQPSPPTPPPEPSATPAGAAPALWRTMMTRMQM